MITDRKQPFYRSKKLTVVSLALALVLVAWFVLHNSGRNPSNASNHLDTSPNIRLIATGDWIAHTSVDNAALQPNGSYNFMPMVSNFLPIFKAADIRFCNDPILNGGKSLGISGYPKFNSPTAFVTDMGKLGCNLVNLASNHSFDFTQANINNSVTAWQKVPRMLAFAGENQNKAQYNSIHYFTLKGVKFAFLAYATYLNSDAPALNSYGLNIYSNSFASKQIAQAKNNGAKFIIVSMRWGTEYSTNVNNTEIQDAQFLADQGVSLILGHGTHVLQPVTWLYGQHSSKTLVWYGLGDFLQSQIPADTVFNGIPVMDINSKTLKISNLAFLPIFMHYDWSATAAATQDLSARNHLHLYLLNNVTQSMINSQQLHTTVTAQEQRIKTTLSSMGLKIPLISSKEYLKTH